MRTTWPTPTPPAGHVPVRSCHITPDMLRTWGFTVSGSITTHDEWKPGIEFGRARHAAVVAGWAVSSGWQDHERTWVGTTKVTAEQRAAGLELIAWFQSTGRIARSGAEALTIPPI